jgi:flagellar protein FliO/FliZ
MDTVALVRIITGLALVVAAILLSAWLARRFGLAGPGPRRPAQLRLLSTLALGPRHKLAVIEIEQQRLLVGIGPQGLTLLHTLAAASQPAAQQDLAECTAPGPGPESASEPSGFASMLAQWLPNARTPSDKS